MPRKLDTYIEECQIKGFSCKILNNIWIYKSMSTKEELLQILKSYIDIKNKDNKIVILDYANRFINFNVNKEALIWLKKEDLL
jgi:hypothetical protein